MSEEKKSKIITVIFSRFEIDDNKIYVVYEDKNGKEYKHYFGKADRYNQEHENKNKQPNSQD